MRRCVIGSILIYLVLVCTCALLAADGPPAVVTMPNGESMDVVGHEWTDKAISDGSFINPNVWQDGTVPTREDTVWVPRGVSLLMHGEMEAKTIVCQGELVWLQDAHLTVSTITGLNGATWRAGSPRAPLSFAIDFVGRHFEHASQIGNGLIWAGHDSTFAMYGTQHGDRPGDEWFSSDGVRGDGRYTVGHPGDVIAKVNLDSNGIQFAWTGEGPRPHLMLMHATGILEGTTLRGFGRTDKSKLLSATNKVGRYAFHNHRAGAEAVTTLRRVYVADSPGWGIVNHSSHVVATACAAVDCYGAGFVCEAANETGGWFDCVAIGMRSDERPHPYERQIANDRWHAGEGFIGAARHDVSACRAVDVGSGFEWLNSGLTETIAGVSRQARYSTGVINGRVHNQPQLPIRDLYVQGYTTHGIGLQWFGHPSHAAPELVTTIENCVVLDGGERASGLFTSYGGPLAVRNVLIKGAQIGIEHLNILPHDYSYTDCVIAGVIDGHKSRDTNMNPTTFVNCTIEASRVGVPLVASRHEHSQRIQTLQDCTIAAPTPFELVYRPAPWAGVYYDNPKGPVVNEVWIDGERVLFPWQQAEE